MEKIICDICGTTYPSSTESCPICGCSNTDAADLLDVDMPYEEFLEETEPETQETPERKKKGIFDFDEVNQDEDPHDDDDEDEDDDEDDEEDDEDDGDDDEEEEAPRHNTFVVILLTVLIVALLGAAGFIFVRYFLPNMGNEETVPTTEAVQQTEAPTTAPTVPCEHMAMTNAGVAELSAEGQQFLLHIKALPENTTDRIIYTSGDESIATVTDDGKITAIAEGETTIYISCGIQRIECPVIVKYVEETVPATTEAAQEETTAPAEDDATDPAEDETVAEETSEAKEDSGLKDVKLKLKRTDIQLGVYYSFRLELDCDLDPEDVTWTSEHPHIAKVDETGSVTAVKAGTTSVTAKYGDQEVKCMVRCIWY